MVPVTARWRLHCWCLFSILIIVVVVMLAYYLPSTTPPTDSSVGTFQYATIRRKAVPALLAYYQDHGSFPSDSEGWGALLGKPIDPLLAAKWRGPYCARDYFVIRQTIELRLLNSMAIYSSVPQEGNAILQLIPEPMEGNHQQPTRKIVLQPINAFPLPALPGPQQLILHETRPLVELIVRYHRDHGKLPGALAELPVPQQQGNDANGVGILLSAIEKRCGQFEYEPLYGRDGFSLFFSGSTRQGAFRQDFDYATPRNETQLSVLIQGGGHKSFLTY